MQQKKYCRMYYKHNADPQYKYTIAGKRLLLQACIIIPRKNPVTETLITTN